MVDLRNLCLDGWHIPTDVEWKQLEMFLGMSSTEADATGYRGTTEVGELKSTRIEFDPIPRWDWPNTGATDEFGFSGLPVGFRRDDNGAFSYRGLVAGTTYYVRAYATNNSGTAYGNQISFTTLSTSIDVDEFNSITAHPNPFENVLTIESEI